MYIGGERGKKRESEKRKERGEKEWKSKKQEGEREKSERRKERSGRGKNERGIEGEREKERDDD